MDLDFLTVPEQVSSLDPVKFQYFNQLFNHRTIILNQEIGQNLVQTVYLPLREFETDSCIQPITLILNSMGGSVSDGFFLAHYLTTYSKELNIIVTGCAASMGAVILCGGGKNPNVHRMCFPSTYGLIHDGYITLSTNESKTASDIMAFNDKVDLQIRDFILSNTNITAEQYDAQTRHQWFLTAEEMKELNLIDEIIGSDNNDN